MLCTAEAFEEQTTPSHPFLKFASLYFLLVTLVTQSVTSHLTALCFPADMTLLFSQALAQALPGLSREKAVGSGEDERGGDLRGRDPEWFLSVAGVQEQLSPAVHLELFIKRCQTPRGVIP